MLLSSETNVEKADFSSVGTSPERIDEGFRSEALMTIRTETSAFKFLYGDQFTISAQLIKPFVYYTSPPTQQQFL